MFRNYHLVFDEFAIQHRRGTWNTRRVGEVIRGFATTLGDYDTAHVIPYPHWMDTRLVGINAGDPTKDYGVWPDQLEGIPPTDGAQLFIFKPEDVTALEKLQALYPQGVLKRHHSVIEGRDFMIYTVPPSATDGNGLEPES
jgi:hypothetical protein